MMETFLKQMQDLLSEGTPFVTVTVVETHGSVPRDEGGRMLVGSSGLQHGTVGGGVVETRAIELAQEMMSEPDPNSRQLVEWNLNKDLGMSCGGSLKLFFERFPENTWDIVIYGAGHVAQALVPLLLTLDCRITCIDHRAEWLHRLPQSPKLSVRDAADLPETVDSISKQAFVLLMTQGHRTDRPILKRFLERGEQAFLGVIGSRAKAATLKKELRDEGMNSEQCNRFTCPLGFSLGGNHPAEIAVSICAQLLYVRDQVLGTLHTRNPVPEHA